jgi:hypothetical protein
VCEELKSHFSFEKKGKGKKLLVNPIFTALAARVALRTHGNIFSLSSDAYSNFPRSLSLLTTLNLIISFMKFSTFHHFGIFAMQERVSGGEERKIVRNKFPPFLAHFLVQKHTHTDTKSEHTTRYRAVLPSKAQNSLEKVLSTANRQLTKVIMNC